MELKSVLRNHHKLKEGFYGEKYLEKLFDDDFYF